MSRPRILIPLASDQSDPITPKFLINRAYVSAVERAGGIPILIGRPDEESMNDLFALADGIMLIGGTDVDPSHYHENVTHSKNIDNTRDNLEMDLLRRAMIKKTPVLGICRGMQVINVAFDGLLYQDIAQEMSGAIQHDWHHIDGKLASRNLLAHDVALVQDSKLAQIVGTRALKVNSLHHQGVKTIARGFRASAHAPDGLVEAIEHESHPFFVGVEWHPEELLNDAAINIFDSFVQCAKGV